MAVAALSVLNGGDATDRTGSAYTTGAILSGGSSTDLLLLRITGIMGTSVNPPAPTTVTGGGVTWTKHNLDLGTGILPWKTTLANRFSSSLWYAVGNLTLASTISIDFGSNAMIGCQWQLARVTGADVSGGGLAAIVQLATNVNQTLANGSSLGLASPLSSPVTAASRTFVFGFSNIDNQNNNVESGYNLLSRSPSQTSPGVNSIGGYHATVFDTTPTIVNNTGTTNAYGIIGLEVKVATATSVLPRSEEVSVSRDVDSHAEASPSTPVETITRLPTPISFVLGKMDGGENPGPGLEEVIEPQITLFWGPFEGSLTFKYPVGGANWEYLLVEKQEIIVLAGGIERDNCRFYVQTVEYDALEKQPLEIIAHPLNPLLTYTRRQTATITVTCAQLWKRFDEYTVQPLTGVVQFHDKIWEAGTPAGEIPRWLLEDAHEHHALAEIGRNFDDTHTSDDDVTPWTKTVDLTFPRETTALPILQWLWDNHATELTMHRRELQAYNWNTLPVNWANEDGPKILLASGRDFLDAPVVIDHTDKANFVTVTGDENRYAERWTGWPGSLPEKTWMVAKPASGVKDPAALGEIADRWLEFFELGPRIERNYALVLGWGHDPLVTYVPGDEVLIQDGTGTDPETFDAKPFRLRVMQITMRKDRTGEWTADIVLRDRIAQRAERMERQIRGLIGGGPGVARPSRFTVPPAAPHGALGPDDPPLLSTEIYTPEIGSGGKNYARVTATGIWSGLDDDGAVCDDFDRYWLRWQYGITKPGWNEVPGDGDPTVPPEIIIDGLEPGKHIRVQLGAGDTTGHIGWSVTAETDLPPDNGEYRAFDGDGQDIFRIGDATDGQIHMQKVPGGALAATGPGFVIQSEVGYKVFGADGSRLINHDFTNGDAEYVGDMHIGGTLTVDGISTLENDVTIYDILTVHADSTFDGDVDITATLNVSGTTSLGGTLTLDANLNANGHTIHGGSFDTDSGIVITGSTITLGSATMTFSGSLITTSGGLAATGALSTSSTITSTGAATIGGTFDHNGSTFGALGAAPVGVQTAGSAATDLATVITLANNLRSGLQNLGFFA